MGTRFLVTLCLGALGAISIGTPVDRVDAITFADDPAIYVPVRDIGAALGLVVGYSKGHATMAGKATDEARRLLDGTVLIPAGEARNWGCIATWDPEQDSVTLSLGEKSVEVVVSEKRVVVDISTQTLTAYQGERVVLTTNVSTGRPGNSTVTGSFVAGPVKDRVHLSRLYDWAPMPWAVQFNGNYFIHGYADVPPEPASHGCVRMPLTGGNPAQWFFSWVDLGTPIEVRGTWSPPG